MSDIIDKVEKFRKGLKLVKPTYQQLMRIAMDLGEKNKKQINRRIKNQKSVGFHKDYNWGAKKLGYSRSTAPISKSVTVSYKQPKMYSKNGSMFVTHKELIATVKTSDNFALKSYTINPGLFSVFPWLSSIAINFEKYKFKKLVFRYIPACSTSTSGSVYMAHDYDVNDDPPSGESAISNFQEVVSGNTWKEIACVSRGNNKNNAKQYYVTPSKTLPNGGDPLNYHLSNFFIATVGGPTDTPVTGGKIWVEYEIELITPVLSTTFLVQNPYYSVCQLAGSNNSSTSRTAPFGLTTDYNLSAKRSGFFDNIFKYVGTNSLGTMTCLQTGSYRIMYEYTSVTAVPTTSTVTLVNTSGNSVQYSNSTIVTSKNNGVVFVFGYNYYIYLVAGDALTFSTVIGSAASETAWLEVLPFNNKISVPVFV